VRSPWTLITKHILLHYSPYYNLLVFIAAKISPLLPLIFLCGAPNYITFIRISLNFSVLLCFDVIEIYKLFLSSSLATFLSFFSELLKRT